MSEILEWVRPDDPCGICGDRIGREVWDLMGAKRRPDLGVIVIHKRCFTPDVKSGERPVPLPGNQDR
jgi:hypothetical protein